MLLLEILAVWFAISLTAVPFVGRVIFTDPQA
jgi:hypothetical protein